MLIMSKYNISNIIQFIKNEKDRIKKTATYPHTPNISFFPIISVICKNLKYGNRELWKYENMEVQKTDNNEMRKIK